MKKHLFAAAALAATSLVSAEVTGPVFLSIDGDEPTQIVAWSLGASNSSNLQIGGGGGGGAGKANFQDLTITRFTDAHSVDLLQDLTLGRLIGSVKLTRDNLIIELRDVIVSSYSVGSAGDPKRSESQTENVSFVYQSIETVVDGVPYCFSIIENKPCE